MDPDETALELIARSDNRVQMVAYGRSEDDLRAVLGHSLTSIGSDGLAMDPDGPSSAGRPHPRSFGCYPRFFGRYVREAGLVPLERAVQMATSAPADRVGLTDRGGSRSGAVADLVVFDPATVVDGATFRDPKLPPTGVRHVIVAGRQVLDEGRQLDAVRAGPTSDSAGRGAPDRPGPIRPRCVHPQARHDAFVQHQPEARTIGQLDPSAGRLDRLLEQLRDLLGRRPVLDRVLVRPGRGRDGRVGMQAGHRQDPRRGAVRHDRPGMDRGELEDAHHLGDPAGIDDVRLQDVRAGELDQVAEVPPVVELLAGRDRDVEGRQTSRRPAMSRSGSGSSKWANPSSSSCRPWRIAVPTE